MKLAADFDAAEWPALRARLEAGDQAAWTRGADILKKRLHGRYLAHAHALLDRKYSGFAVLAIDSAVVETLEQFRRGTVGTPSKQVRAYFEAFLTETRLGQHFTKETAGLYYTTIRCGILHQTETKADSRVNKKVGAPVVELSVSGKGLVINARRFHEELEAALDDHAEALASGDAALRDAFVKKMKHVAREDSVATVV